MKLIFSSQAWDDYQYWQKTDKKMVERINKLIKEAKRTPFSGIGKPEPLKYGLAGYGSRRLDDEHRFVYKPGDDELLIAGLRYHY